MPRITSADWEDSRCEFFQEIYPSDRSTVSDSLSRGGGRTSLPSTTSRSRGRVVAENACGTTERNPIIIGGISQPSQSQQQLATSASTRISSNDRVSTLDSRRSNGGTTIPIASTTTIDEVAETNSYTNLHEEASNALHMPMNVNMPDTEQTPLSQTTNLEPSVETAIGTSLNNHVGPGIRLNNNINTRVIGRSTRHRHRMRAAVQGLEEDDSDQDVEVLDFTDGMILQG